MLQIISTGGRLWSRGVRRSFWIALSVTLMAVWTSGASGADADECGNDHPCGGVQVERGPAHADTAGADDDAGAIGVASPATGSSRPQGCTQGTTLVVNSPLFIVDPNDGVLTIVEAVDQANVDGGPTQITFDATVFPPEAPVTILTLNRLTLSEACDTVDGTGAGVVFTPDAGATDSAYAFELVGMDLTIRQLSFDAYGFGGIRATDGATGLIEDVEVANSFASLGRGIYIRAGASMTVRNCYIHDVVLDGIGVNTASAVVEDCLIERAGDDGLSAWGSDLTSHRNTMLDCTEKGILFDGDPQSAPPGTLTLSSFEIYWDGTNVIVGDNTIRPTGTGSDIFVNPAGTVVSETPVDLGSTPPPALDTSQPVDFYLPYDTNQLTFISQGVDGWRTHTGRVAYDMRLYNRVGQPVRASAPGRVIRVFNGAAGPGSDRPANYVWIDHGFGIIAAYRHVDLDSITVTPGQLVGRYDPIAAGGVSGHVTGPHTHVEFFKRYVGAVWPWEVCFKDVPPDPCGVPQEEMEYTSANTPLPPDGFVDSTMAGDVFIDPGDPNTQGDEYVIQLTDSVPMAYYRTGQKYMFRGTVPAGVQVVRLWVRDYETRRTLATIEGLVDNGRFAVGFQLPDTKAGAYRIGLAGTTDPNGWTFHFDRTLPIIVAGPTGLVDTPPDEGPPVWPPDGDQDGDGIPNQDDPWVDVMVNTALWDDGGDPTTVTIQEAITIANKDWRPTYVRFDPAVFPVGAPATIPCQRNLDIGNDGDVFDATGAGVIFQYVGPPEQISSAFDFRGAGSMLRNVSIIDYPGNGIRVGSMSQAVIEDVTVTSGGRRAIRGSWSSDVQIRRAALTGLDSKQFSACWMDEDSTLLMQDVTIRRGRAGVFLGRRSVGTLTNVDIAGTTQFPVQLMLLSKGTFDNLTIQGRPDFASIWTERRVQFTLKNSDIAGGLQGIFLADADVVSVINSRIHDVPTEDGIVVSGLAELTLENTIIRNTARHGLYVPDTGIVHTCDGRVFDQGSTVFLGTNKITRWGQSGQGQAISMPNGGQIAGGACTFGDSDSDGDVDLDDFAAWPGCQTGPVGGSLPRGCTVFDFDLDGDVDQQDAGAFQLMFSGPI